MLNPTNRDKLLRSQLLRFFSVKESLANNTTSYVYPSGLEPSIAEKVTNDAVATDNALARFDGVTGKIIKDSSVVVDDSGNIVTPGTVKGAAAVNADEFVTKAQAALLANILYIPTQPALVYNGVDTYSTVADNEELNFGIGDFSIFVEFATSDNISSNQYVILKGVDGGTVNGYALYLTGSKISIFIGENSTRHIINTNIPIVSNTRYKVVVCYDRNGDVELYINNVKVFNTDISSYTASVDIAQPFYLATKNTTPENVFNGIVSTARLFNKALTPTEVEQITLTGEVPYYLQNGSNVALYASDFSADVNGWAATRTVISGNNDAISDGVTSKDNVLKIYATADNATHNSYKSGIASPYALQRHVINYYIPSGQTNVDGFTLTDGAGNPVYDAKSTGATPATIGTWTTLIVEANWVAGTSYQINLTKGASTSFIGANSASDDIIYISSYILTKLGQTWGITPEGRGHNTDLDVNGKNNATHTKVNLSGVPQNHVEQLVQKGITGDTKLLSSDYAIPAGYMIDMFLIENTTANQAILDCGTTAGGDDIFSTVTIIANDITPVAPIKQLTSTLAQSALYLNDDDAGSSWNSATINVYVLLKKIK